MRIIFCVALVFTVGRCKDDQSFVTITVCVGEEVTLKCRRQNDTQYTGTLFWIRLADKNLPKVLAATYTFENGAVRMTPGVTAKKEAGTFDLRMTKTELSDTAFYYCYQVVELQTTFLNTTFLRVKEPEPDITTIIQDIQPHPVRSGDSVTLQCSVLSDSENKTCAGNHSVFWFRANSDESYPSVIYTLGNKGHECENSLDSLSLRKCVYNFSRNVNSSDAGTYYCAVATCGEIFFGNGARLDIEAENIADCHRAHKALYLLCAALAVSLIVIALLMFTIRKKKGRSNGAAAPQTNTATSTDDQQSQQTEEGSLVYYVPDFTRWKGGRSVRRGANVVESESIYADVRVLE